MTTLLEEVKGDPENEYSKEIITCEWQIMLNVCYVDHCSGCKKKV